MYDGNRHGIEPVGENLSQRFYRHIGTAAANKFVGRENFVAMSKKTIRSSRR